GRAPSPIPSYSFAGPSGVQPPLQQPAIGLTLDGPYSLPLRGTLAMSFQSDVFGPNPAVQFSTGGRTAPFTIPAGTTQARFENGGVAIRLQTGSIAGSIVVTPSFSTVEGLSLTPVNGPSLTLAVERSAPRLLDLALASRSQSAFTITVTGYSTTRQVRRLEARLAPKPGERIANATITVDLEAAGLAWFGTDQSLSFGGLFSMTVPFALTGEPNQDLVSKIQSVDITVSNEVGQSNSISVGF
ncbi:MAG: hypothetical protein SFV51_21775, partial [Bryobacteraceae bacterium]|nr:hypothetical protein [Bryobacteraceae bacterium]